MFIFINGYALFHKNDLFRYTGEVVRWYSLHFKIVRSYKLKFVKIQGLILFYNKLFKFVDGIHSTDNIEVKLFFVA